MRLSGIGLGLLLLSFGACAPAHVPATPALLQGRAFSAGTVSIAVDAKRPGPALTRDQLGANMLVSVPESGKPAYLPLLKSAGIQLLRWPGGNAADEYQWQTNSWSRCSPYLQYPPSNGNAFDRWMARVAKPMRADVAITVNYGSSANCSSGGDPAVAAAWVDHANNVMHDGIRYWTVGNEQYFKNTNTWPGSHDGAAYGRRVARLFYPMMKAKDPSILVGVDMAFGNATYDAGNDPWDDGALRLAKYDFVEMHYYPEYFNLDDDDALLTTWSDQIAANFSGARKLLAKYGHPSAPIFMGEFDRDAGGPHGLGHESVSIVDALFTAILIGEVTKAGVGMSSAWLAFGDCDAETTAHASHSYGWQHFGTFDMFSVAPPGYDFTSCAQYGFPRMTPFPKGRAYQLATRFVTPGERVLATSSTGLSVRAYGATKGAGYAFMLINVSETASQTASVRVDHAAAGFDAVASVYDKAIYDRSKRNVWDGPATKRLGHVGNPFVLTLPPWSVTVVTLR